MWDIAANKTGVMHMKVRQRPRLLPDNSPGYVASECNLRMLVKNIWQLFPDLQGLGNLEGLSKRNSEAREPLFFVCR
jgi:hypothetical protein